MHRGEEKRFRLRSNREHILIIKHQENEKIVTVYPKIGIGWAFLDLFFGEVPMVNDVHTGNWNHFDGFNAIFK